MSVFDIQSLIPLDHTDMWISRVLLTEQTQDVAMSLGQVQISEPNVEGRDCVPVNLFQDRLIVRTIGNAGERKR
jgi:hypothetical protein